MSTWNHLFLKKIADFLNQHMGLSESAYQKSDIESRIHRCMSAAKVIDPEAYLGLIQCDKIALNALVNEITVNETYFFRESKHFDFIKKNIVKTNNRKNRVWSAGCSSGEEAYSLAMIFSQMLPAQDFSILATDVSLAMLTKANCAIFGQWSMRNVDPAILVQYFTKYNNQYHLNKKIKNMVQFKQLNFVADDYPSIESGVYDMDLIMFRNVLMYIDKNLAQMVLDRVVAALAPGGVLLMGSSDPIIDNRKDLKIVIENFGLCYRKQDVHAQCECQSNNKYLDSTQSEEIKKTDFTNSLWPDSNPKVTVGSDKKNFNIQKIQEMIEAKNTQEAIEKLNTIILDDELQPELHFLKATLLVDKGEINEAIQNIKRAIFLDPFFLMAHFFLGDLLLRKRKTITARKYYITVEHLAQARPDNEQVPFGDGMTAGALAKIAKVRAGNLG